MLWAFVRNSTLRFGPIPSLATYRFMGQQWVRPLGHPFALDHDAMDEGSDPREISAETLRGKKCWQ
jgi:hypothetical protein